ncbi:MAG: long-chain fatty acid--CoA ligase [Clostridiales Family XIII bacterium]|nr:long-chain fatty acid--CoA ligase [Clostridiales Family XIII bacterium]
MSVGSIYKTVYAPDRAAIYFDGETITYEQVDDRVRAFANFFKALGVGKGDRVMLDFGNCPEFLYAYLGVVRCAGIIVPVNPMLTIGELEYIAKDCEARYLFIAEGPMASHKYTKEGLAGALGVQVVVYDTETAQAIDASARDDFDLITDSDELSTFLYTSGTTGGPKAAMLSHGNLISNAGQAEAFWYVDDKDSIMCVLPMFHVFAFTLCVLLPLKAGGTIALIESFTPKAVISVLLEKEVSIFMGVPAMLMVITEAMKKDGIRFPKLRIAAYGGASTPLALFNTLVELNIPPSEGFGLTEGSPAVLLNPAGKGRAMSCGMPISGVECRIVDENDQDLPVGEVGELLFRGPNMMKGYYNRPEETAEAMRGGWLHTGDLAKRDEDDYYYIVDRKKDIIIVSGLNVYPREIEEVLFKHPKIKEAAVIGVPDNLRGEAVVAYVVLKDPEETVHHRDILRWMKEQLALYKIPRRIEIIDALPRNSSGKILKRLLKEQG